MKFKADKENYWSGTGRPATIILPQSNAEIRSFLMFQAMYSIPCRNYARLVHLGSMRYRTST